MAPTTSSTIPSTRHLHPGYGKPSPPTPLPPLQPPSSFPTRQIPRIPSRPESMPYTAPFGPGKEFEGWKVETLCFEAAKPRRVKGSVKLRRDRDLYNLPRNLKLTGEDVEKLRDELRTEIGDADRQAEAEFKELDAKGLRRKADQQESLFVAVNRYYREQKPRDAEQRDRKEPGVTILASHGNGLCKEMWEPVLGRLITIHEQDDSLPRIEEIWSLDNDTNGDSAILNEGYIGPLAGDWHDSARDILQFVLHYLPHKSSPSPLSPPSGSDPEGQDEDPTLSHWSIAAPVDVTDRNGGGTDAMPGTHVEHWDRESPTLVASDAPSDTDRSASREYFTPHLLPVASHSKPPAKLSRNLIFLAMSVGSSCQISAVATLLSPHPPYRNPSSLPFKIHSWILIDPTMEHPNRKRLTGRETEAQRRGGPVQDDYRIFKWAISRKSTFDGKEDASRSLERWLGNWHPEMKKRFLGMGIWKRPDEKDGKLELKCPTRLEAAGFIHPVSHAFQSLSTLPIDQPLLFLILPDPSAMYIPADVRDDFFDLLRAKSMSRNLDLKVFPGQSHFIHYEKPDLVAREIGAFLQRCTVSNGAEGVGKGHDDTKAKL